MAHSSHRNYETWIINPFETDKTVMPKMETTSKVGVSEALKQDKPRKARRARAPNVRF